MCCLHRFLDYHTEGIFPSWDVKKLFIGTFNPSWNKPNNNADYFYGRSNYFWRVLPRFVNENTLENSSIEEKISFCQRNQIGFTDLIKRVENAHCNNPDDKEKILSFRDSDLLSFGGGVFYNTFDILEFIDNNPKLEKVYFTFLGQNAGAISLAMIEIEQYCQQKEIPTYRLHTHTGQGLGKGIPRDNALTNRWFDQGLNFDNNFNPNAFPIQI